MRPPAKEKAKEEENINYIKKFRERKGLTRKELAQMSGVALSTISHIENHKQQMSREVAAKLAKVLECKTSDLADEEEFTVKRKDASSVLNNCIGQIREYSFDFATSVHFLLRAYLGDESNLYRIIEELFLADIELDDDRTEQLLEAIRSILKH